MLFQEVIHEAPQSLAALLEVILPRIQPRVEVRGVSLEDQQSFVGLSYVGGTCTCITVSLLYAAPVEMITDNKIKY